MEEIGNYFKKEKINFIPTGCKLLDLALGGGYPLGRIVNIVGDYGTGKTLLALEAFANFKLKYPEGLMFYHEAEAAFDIEYAESLGLPVDNIVFIDNVRTIEDFYNKLCEVIKICKEKNVPGLYILDSLDAMTDKDEMERDISEKTFATTKQKKLSELFRRTVVDLSNSDICLIVISQVRENIGVLFGDKYRRSGGKALDFYASQVIWLAEVEKIQKTVKKIKRTIGITIKARCKKNKISLPFRDATFPLIFGYGIDDVEASRKFLETCGMIEEVMKELNIKSMKDVYNSKEIKEQFDKKVEQMWNEIEDSFTTKKKKYGE